MKIPKILRCSTCNRELNEFETSKWHNLVDYWGGKIGNRKQKCSTCYHLMIKEAQERSTL